MTGIEISHLNGVLRAIETGVSNLENLPVEDAITTTRYGKIDTLGLDTTPEVGIESSLTEYDDYAILITEERLPKAKKRELTILETMYVCDPTDRSSQFRKYLEDCPDPSMKVGQYINSPENTARWEEMNGSPAIITGSSTAITCVRRQIPIFSVIVNYITRDLFVSCSAGNYFVKLPSDFGKIDLEYILNNGTKLFFRPNKPNDFQGMRRFVTFLGKSGYNENFLDSGLLPEKEMTNNLHYNLPGGPTRALYLSMFQPETVPIGFVLANGEKIGEWIHWLPFVAHARMERNQSEPVLDVYEIYQDRPWTKEGILMATAPFYSIFKEHPTIENTVLINTDRLQELQEISNPSQFRCTLLVAPRTNSWIRSVVKKHGYRQICFPQ